MVSHTTLKQNFQSLTQISKKKKKEEKKEKKKKLNLTLSLSLSLSLPHRSPYPSHRRPTHHWPDCPPCRPSRCWSYPPTAAAVLNSYHSHPRTPLLPHPPNTSPTVQLPLYFFFFYIKESILHASPLFVYVFLVSGYGLLF